MTIPYSTTNPPVGTLYMPSPTIQVGDINFTDEAAAYNDNDLDGSVIADYYVQCEYIHNSHTYMLGITSPSGFQGASVAFCQLAAPTLLWVADWTAARFLTQPDIPDPYLGTSEWVFLGAHFQPVQLVVAADGVSQLYRISGVYLYGKRNPSSIPTNDIRFPLPPWLQDKFDRTMPTSKLKKGIISPPDLIFAGRK